MYIALGAFFGEILLYNLLVWMNHCKTVGLLAWLEANTQVQYVRVINIFFNVMRCIIKSMIKMNYINVSNIFRSVWIVNWKIFDFMIFH